MCLESFYKYYWLRVGTSLTVKGSFLSLLNTVADNTFYEVMSSKL